VRSSTPSDNTTLTDVVARYVEAGFGATFEPVGADGSLRCLSCGTVASAAAYTMHSMRRLEGASDPADMIAVVAATCCNCGAAGTLVLAYGPAGAAADSEILIALEDARSDTTLPVNSAPGETIGDKGSPSPAHDDA
jgi:hypothetical protein